MSQISYVPSSGQENVDVYRQLLCLEIEIEIVFIPSRYEKHFVQDNMKCSVESHKVGNTEIMILKLIESSPLLHQQYFICTSYIFFQIYN